jgi:hypothetical protein
MSSVIDVGPYRTRVVEQPHEGRVYVERTQVNEQAILEFNKELQKDQLLRDLSFGRWAAKIPTLAFHTIIPRDYPEYLTGDGNTRKATLMRMLVDHPEWLVQPKENIIAKR